jgi:predicted DNA-binding transcriptional regulator YafY
MKRADRLAKIVQTLRGGGTHIAADLAVQFGVSQRSIYRDMDTLTASGVPVQGERGTGYFITAPVSLPPLNLSMAELEALHVGLLAVGQSGDPTLAAAAEALSDKIDAAIPEDGSVPDGAFGYVTDPMRGARAALPHLAPLRQAVRTRQRVMITMGTERTVRPLKIEYWGRIWTCAVWCETTRGFEDIRIDQITALRVLPSLFVDEVGKRLIDRHP